MPDRSRQRARRASPFALLRRRRRLRPCPHRLSLRAEAAPVPGAAGRQAFPSPRIPASDVSSLSLTAGMGAAPRPGAARASARRPDERLPQPAPSATEAPPPGDDQPTLPGLALPGGPVARLARPASDPRAALAEYPDISAEDLCRHAKRLGKAAELLVDSLLTRLGERMFPADEHEPFDRLLWLAGRPLRVQIKARHRRIDDVWAFNVTRGYGRSPEGVRRYADDDFDLLALVILPECVVKFMPRGAPRHRIHQREIPGLRARPRDSLDAALRALGRDEAVPQPAEPDAA